MSNNYVKLQLTKSGNIKKNLCFFCEQGWVESSLTIFLSSQLLTVKIFDHPNCYRGLSIFSDHEIKRDVVKKWPGYDPETFDEISFILFIISPRERRQPMMMMCVNRTMGCWAKNNQSIRNCFGTSGFERHHSFGHFLSWTMKVDLIGKGLQWVVTTRRN